MSDPFTTLGLEPVFALSLPALERRQRELNRALHPDQHSSNGSGQRQRALHRAMDINQAYRTLRDPALRAAALLELLGAPAGAAQAAASPPELLMEMMTQREQLDAARRSRDTKKIGELAEAMADREHRLLDQLAAAFAPLERTSSRTDPASSDTGQQTAPFQLAFDRLAELRYVRRFRDEVRTIEDEL